MRGATFSQVSCLAFTNLHSGWGHSEYVKQVEPHLQLGVYTYLTTWKEAKILSRDNSVLEKECTTQTNVWKGDRAHQQVWVSEGKNGSRPTRAGTRIHPDSANLMVYVSLAREESGHQIKNSINLVVYQDPIQPLMGTSHWGYPRWKRMLCSPWWRVLKPTQSSVAQGR